MSDTPKRPPVRIRFRFNVETGEMELIIDDSAPDRSEDYHDEVAKRIARFLASHPEIRDAGHIRYRMDREWRALVEKYEREERERETLEA